MKALVTGGAGFIGSHLSERLLEPGRARARDRRLYGFLSAAVEGTQSRRTCAAATATSSSKAICASSISRSCSTASRTSFTSPRRPACAAAGAATSASTPASTSMPRSACSKPASASRSSGSSTRRARRSTATTCEIPMVETAAAAAGFAVRRDQAGRRAALPPLLRQLRRALPFRCGISPSMARGSGPTWGSTASLRAILDGKPLVQFGDGLQTRDFTFVADAAKATADAAVRGVPGRVYNIGGGARVSLREVFDLIARVSGPQGHDRSAGPAKGRHARHLRRHDAGQGRPGLRAVGDARRGSSRDVALDGSESMISDFGSSGFRIGVRIAVRGAVRPRWPAAPRRPTRCRRAPPTRTSSCSIAAPKPRRTRSGSTRANTSAISSTTIRRARSARREAGARRYLHQRGQHRESLLLAANEFREFLTFYPTHRARRLRAAAAGAVANRADARARARSDRDHATRSRKSRSSCSGFPTAS